MEDNGIWPSFQQPHVEPVSVLLPVPTSPAQERGNVPCFIALILSIK